MTHKHHQAWNPAPSDTFGRRLDPERELTKAELRKRKPSRRLRCQKHRVRGAPLTRITRGRRDVIVLEKEGNR